MGKTRNLFKKVRDTKGLFHAKLVTIKDRNGMDLLEETLNIYLGGMFLMKPVGNCISKSRTEHSVETDRGNISCKDWLNKGQKWYGPNRSRTHINQTNEDQTQRANVKSSKGKATNNTQEDPHKDNS